MSGIKGNWNDVSINYEPQTDNVYLHVNDISRSDGWTIFHIGIKSNNRESRYTVLNEAKIFVNKIKNSDRLVEVENKLKHFHIQNSYHEFILEEWKNFIKEF